MFKTMLTTGALSLLALAAVPVALGCAELGIGEEPFATSAVSSTGDLPASASVASGLPKTEAELVERWDAIFKRYRTLSRAEAREQTEHGVLFWETCWRYVAEEIDREGVFMARLTATDDAPINSREHWEPWVEWAGIPDIRIIPQLNSWRLEWPTHFAGQCSGIIRDRIPRG